MLLLLLLQLSLVFEGFFQLLLLLSQLSLPFELFLFLFGCSVIDIAVSSILTSFVFVVLVDHHVVAHFLSTCSDSRAA